MNTLFLLKLIQDLIKDNQVTSEQLKCARTILDNLIKYYDKPLPLEEELGYESAGDNPPLDPEAEQARQELMNE